MNPNTSAVNFKDYGVSLVQGDDVNANTRQNGTSRALVYVAKFLGCMFGNQMGDAANYRHAINSEFLPNTKGPAPKYSPHLEIQ